MLELAIAEVYRPDPYQRQRQHQRPRSQAQAQAKSRPRLHRNETLSPIQRAPSFAINLTASTRRSTFSFRTFASRSSRESRTASVNSASTSANVARRHSFHPFSFVRRRTDTTTTAGIDNKVDMTESVERIDSLLSPGSGPGPFPLPLLPLCDAATASVVAHNDETGQEENESTQDRETPSTSHHIVSDLRVIPPAVPLPPQEELEDFDAALESAIKDLLFHTTSYSTSPCPSAALPRSAALTILALEHMSHLSDLSACVAVSFPEYFALITHAARRLTSAVPPTELSVKNTVVRCLALIAQRWDEEVKDRHKEGTAQMASVAGEVFEEMVLSRGQMGGDLGSAFAGWIGGVDTEHNYHRRHVTSAGERRLHVVALEPSVVVLDALVQVLANDALLSITLFVPCCTECLFDHALWQPWLSLPPLLRNRLQVTTHHYTALDSFGEGIDVLLLEVQSLDAGGNARCAKTALDAVQCIKMLAPRGKVALLDCIDAISAMSVVSGESGAGGHKEFDVVPAQLVDVYLGETGVLKLVDVENLAKRAEELDKHVLGKTA